MDFDTRQNFKAQLYEQFARVGKAFASPRRLEIIDLLAQTEHTVEDLASKTGMSIASVSQHLQVLRSARVVDVDREGTYAWYRLASPRVFTLWQIMREFAQNSLSEIDHLMHLYFKERYSLDTMDADELLRRLREDSVTILDVRPDDEYRAGHVPHALSIPLDQLEKHLTTLPRDRKIVAYCRASYCLLSDEAALLLRERGFDVSVFSDGMPVWRAMGLPVETGDD